MSKFIIPNDVGQIRQVNRGDKAGELWATFNIDLTTSPGKIKVSKKLARVLDTTFLGGHDIQAVFVNNGFYYALTTDTLWRCNVGNDPRESSSWAVEATLDGTSGMDLGFESDAEPFGGAILISAGTDIHRLVPGSSFDVDWWTGTVSGTALTTSVPHIMHTHQGGNATVFVTDGNKFRYYNAAAGHSTITLDNDLVGCCIASGVSTVWGGTYAKSGDRAYVYEMYVGEQLDGTPIARNAYPVDGRAVLSIEVIDNIPHVITEKGILQAFNGVGFSTVAYLPFAYSNSELAGVRASSVEAISIDRPVHPKGMRARNRSLLIAINTENAAVATTDPVDERTPSGVWEYNADTQVLHHRQALTNAATQYGWQKQLRSGPLAVVDTIYTSILVAGEAGTDGIGLFAESDEANQGYIITSEIGSQTVKDTFNKAVIKARTLQDDEAIVLKSRAEKDSNFPQYNDIVWLSATEFTCTASSMGNASVGDEIEITEGYRAGYLAHITAIEGTNTRKVTIDESIGVLNQTSRIRLQNWTKAGAEYTDEDGEVKSIGIGEPKPWMQFKLQLTGDIELRQFISDGKSKNEF